MIQVNGLTKVFKIQHRRPGFRGTIQDLFSLHKSVKIAIENLQFTIKPGGIRSCYGEPAFENIRVPGNNLSERRNEFWISMK
ncbi:MAG TPA: hypothetical protein VHY08_23460 [Bacillota bacterium]|nr:hypothetical protein [Bacillota bacterium]